MTTEEEKLAYIERFLKREGVHLKMEDIERNEGLRLLAKLCLNSFWGKCLEVCFFVCLLVKVQIVCFR